VSTAHDEMRWQAEEEECIYRDGLIPRDVCGCPECDAALEDELYAEL
jgi:hypothetical protein